MRQNRAVTVNRRRSTLLLGLATVAALVAAGCASDDDDDADGGEAFEAGELGAVTIGPDDPIEIGSIQVQTTDDAPLGRDQDVAIRVAVADKGELLGHEIQLHDEDGECDPEAGTSAAQRLVSEPQVVGVIGTSCSGAGVAAAGILAPAGVPLISGSNTAPRLTSDLEGTEGDAHQHGYLRTAHNDVYQGRAAAQFAYDELGARKAVTVHSGDAYTEGLATAFGDWFETELGGEVVLATSVSEGDENLRPMLTDAAAEEPDMIFMPLYEAEGGFLAAQSKGFDELNSPDMLMGADALLSETFVANADSEDMYFSGPATPESTAYEDFVQRYEDESGQSPIQSFHAHAYDATNMLFAAIEQVAEVEDDGTIHIDRAALIEALYETEGLEGLTGTLSCDEFGDCAEPAINILRNTADEETISDVLANKVVDTYRFDEE